MYRTGETSPRTGSYAWVQYTDGTRSPPPTAREMVIPLSKGETFPPIKSSGKGAIWRNA